MNRLPRTISKIAMALLLLTAWLPAPALASTLSAPQHEPVLTPPRSGLQPVHMPELGALEPEVREQLSSLQNSVLALVKDPAISAHKLSETYGLMGQVYHAYSLTSPAEACYLNAHSLDANDFRWVHLLGSLYQQEGRPQEAIKYFEVVRKLQPRYVAAAVYLGNLYLQQNRVEEARASFKEALVISPVSAAAKYGLGQVALSGRDYSGAVSYFGEALAAAPEANRIHYSLAMAYRGLGNMESAQAHLARQGVVGVRVSDPLVDGLQDLIRGERVHLLRGRLAFEAGRFSEAADEFKKAAAAKPESVPARVNLGSTLARMGDVRGALDQYRETLRIDPKNAAAQYNVGVLLAQRNEHEGAISYLKTAVELNPKDLDARALLAKESLKAGRIEDAQAEFTRVVEADQENEDALLDLVNILIKKGDQQQALERLEKGYSIFPQRGRTAVLLAYLLAASPRVELRNGARALDIAGRAYEATGLINHGAIVAMALAELGRCSEAADWQRRMIAAAESEQKTDLIGKLKADLQLYEKPTPCRPPSK